MLHSEDAKGGGVFTIQCFDKDGNLKWEDLEPNIVVNTGLQLMNTQFFKGSAYTGSFFIGLVTGPAASNTYLAADTLALHTGWTESTAYSGTRKAVTFGTATTATPSVISNSGAAVSFTMNATTIIGGALLCTVASGTAGTLFSVASFSAPGDRSVVNSDVINVTYTFSLASA